MASLSELRKAARAGASLRIDADSLSVSELRWIARDAKDGGGRLTIFNADTLKEHQRDSIVREAPGQVEFEFK